MKRLMLASVLALTMALSLGASTAAAANNSKQAGLVNVSAGDVELLNNVNLAAAVNVLVTLCGVPINVAVLATQLVGGAQTFACDAATGPITIDQSQPGDGGGTPSLGGNNSRQFGLVNVSLGDVAILNNVNVGVAANLLITACGVPVNVAVLAVQAISPTSTFSCDSTVGAITMTQS